MARGSGDIVYDIGGNSTGLVDAAERGARAIRGTDKAVDDLKKQVERLSQSSTQFQRNLNATIGVSDKFARSAKASAAAFSQGWDKASSQVDRLRNQLDPLYASSMRYQSAVENLDNALKRGVITQAEYTRLTNLAAESYLATGNAAATATARFGAVGAMFQKNGQAIQMAGYQIQDFAVQVAGGTDAMRAFGQQAPQLASFFGPLGTIIGTFAAVTLPLLGAAFASAGEDADSFGDKVSALEKAIQAVDEAAKIHTAQGLTDIKEKYGEINADILDMIARQSELATAMAENTAQAAIQSLADQYGALAINLNAVGHFVGQTKEQIRNLAKELGIPESAARSLVKALQDASNAKDALARAEALARVDRLLALSSESGGELRKQIQDAESAMRHLAEAAPKTTWLGSAIDQAETLATNLREALKAKAAYLQANATGTSLAPLTSPHPPTRGAIMDGEVLGSGDTGSSGSSGGGGQSVADKLQSLQDELMTEAEAEAQSYADRQALLEEALNNKLITLQKYNELMQAAQEQHSQAMEQIDVWRYGTGLAQAQEFFGSMANALQSGNERMQKIGRTFAAIEALINAYRAFNQVLADPSLPWFAKIPKAVAVLAAGMNVVNAIKGGGGGGHAKVASASSGAQAAAASPANVNIQWNGDLSASSLGSLTKKLNDEFKQGYRLNLVVG